MKVLIQNGRILDPANQLDKVADLAVKSGKIFAIDTIPADFTPDRVIDAQNCWVLPGFIDLCCRPQVQHPQGTTLQQEAQAALKRGITSLCIPPDGEPIVDTSANVLRLIQQGSSKLPHIYPIGALSVGLEGTLIADLTALHAAGCVAFSNAQQPITDLSVLRHCYEYVASFDLTLVIQPQDPWLANYGIAHEGSVAMRLGLPGIPETAETVAVAQQLLLIEQCQVRAHFTCLSSAKSVELIQQAKKQGIRVSADTAMHQLHLTEQDVLAFDANCHLYPPLRSQRDREGLLKGVNAGILDAICSDHRPLDSIAKLAPFGDTVPGISAIDTLFSLGLKLVEENALDLMALIGALTFKPAQIFNLSAGTLSIGARADICIVDPKKQWHVNESNLFSKGKNTPFKHCELPGVITHTLLSGKLAYEL